jgi:hypothetical protein
MLNIPISLRACTTSAAYSTIRVISLLRGRSWTARWRSTKRRLARSTPDKRDCRRARRSRARPRGHRAASPLWAL